MTRKIQLLEALRGFAAVYVLFHHLTLRQKNIFGYFFAEGQAAVILFFILSGFVIYLSTNGLSKKRELHFKEYFIKRFRRIYPVFIVALILAYAAQSITAHRWLPLNAPTLLGNLLNLQDFRLPGNWFVPYYRNTPLWSLSYEWWYYMLFFPIFKFIRADRQKYFVLVLSVLGFISFYFFPNKISITLEYFFIWWTGVELARSWLDTGKVSVPALKYIFTGFAIMIGLLLLQVVFYQGVLDNQDHPIIELRHYTYAILIVTAGLIWKKYNFIFSHYFIKFFIKLAPISYGIYVFHFPFIYKKNNIFGLENFYLKSTISLILIVALAYFFEVFVQKKINKFSQRFIN